MRAVDEIYPLITQQPGISLTGSDHEIYRAAPAVPDADDDDAVQVVPGDLSLEPWNQVSDETPTEHALRSAIAMTVVDCLHETAEWLRLDAKRVFIPHTTQGVHEWDVLKSIAWEAAGRMLDEHPRTEP